MRNWTTPLTRSTPTPSKSAPLPPNITSVSSTACKRSKAYLHGGGKLADLMAQGNHPNRLGHELVAFALADWFIGTPHYPQHWWAPASKDGAPSWEILPQEAAPGEVILSKRNELGLLSNFAPTPFEFHGKRYASVEGFWQMMKYPEGADDSRSAASGVEWKYTRDQVAAMTGFDAKHAGDLGEANMKKLGIAWVSFEGKHFEYRSEKREEHYQLIVAAMREKLRQNPEVKQVLLETGNLALRPDHHQEESAPPEWALFRHLDGASSGIAIAIELTPRHPCSCHTPKSAPLVSNRPVLPA